MKSAIGFLSTLMLIYFAGAFVNADLNPFGWAMTARAFIACVSLFLAVVVAMALYDE